MRNFVKVIFSGALVSFALSGCGGGGSSSDDVDTGTDFSNSELLITTTSAFNPVAGVANADVQLFWEQKRKYDFYRILVNPDGRSGFTKIGPRIFSEDPEVDSDEDVPIFLSRLVGRDLEYKIAAFLFKWPDAVFLLVGCTGNSGDVECERVGEQGARDLSPGVVDIFSTRSPDSQFSTTYGISVAISEDALTTAVGANTATLFECKDDEIIDVDEEAVENCERQVFPECEDIPAGEDLPEDCPDPDAPVFKLIANAGAVYVYTRETAVADWGLAQILQASNPGIDDNFGWSVSMSDDASIIVATAPGEDSSERAKPNNNSKESSGAAYVFRNDGDQWRSVSYLKATNAELNDLFGWTAAVAGNGSVIAVGANQRSACEGAVYTFEPNESGVWAPADFIRGPARKSNDLFGNAVSIDYKGKTLAVGAPQFPAPTLQPGCVESNPSNAGSGVVHVYSRVDAAWELDSSVKANNADPGDRFGWSVSLNGNAADTGRATHLLVGAPSESGESQGVNGSGGNNEARVASGAAYLFKKRSGQWTQTQYLKASNAGPTDQFGNSVSMGSGGTVLAVGAWGESGTGFGINPIGVLDFVRGSGAAYVFQEDATPGLWSEVAYVKAPLSGPLQSFGWTLDLADQERALIVGAPGFLSGQGNLGNAFVY